MEQPESSFVYPKKTIITLVAFLVISFGFLGWAVYRYFSVQRANESSNAQNVAIPQTEEEKRSESLRAPSEVESMPEEVQKSLRAPSRGKPLPKDILESLHAPNP